MQDNLCYHFKCIYLLIMMEWSNSRVNSATDMCFRDYCVFCMEHLAVMRRQNHAARFNHCITKVSKLQ